MRKSSLQRALLFAGAVALAGVGVAQAETYDSPTQAGEASTMTYGQPNMLTDNGPVMNYDWTINNTPSTTVLGAGPVVEHDYYTYTTPSTTVLGAGPVMNYDWTLTNPSTTVLGAGPTTTITTYSYGTPMVCGTWGHDGASETSNVPQRAGEVSTMTGGAPNMLTNNYSC